MTTVASANVLFTLPPADATAALDLVLASEPDLVGLQEWYVSRLGLLRRTGDVRLVPGLGLPGLRVRAANPAGPQYHWVSAVGADTVVGARADRFDLLESRAALISPLARADRPDRFLSTEPPRFAAVGIFGDRGRDRTIAILSFHLTATAEHRGRYREDRPLLARRHQDEVRAIERLVEEYHRAGHVVYAVGDANFDAQRFTGLTSSWLGREDEPGTFGSGTRKLDDVHGPGPATEVRLISTPSDHRAVLTTRPD